MSDVKIKGLHKHFGVHEVLHGIDLDIASGEFVVFVGPSGCGKSTLLRCISGLEPISEGLIEIDGVDVSPLPPDRRGVAMVFQSYALYPHMTVFDNIAFSLRLQKCRPDEIRTRVHEVSEKLRLTAYLDRLPALLSGGQRQRVAIGRAIIRDPKIFLFDEPLSNLDASLRVQMRMEIAQLKNDLPNTTMIYVTHDQVEAMTLADRIVILRDGRVEHSGTPMELYDHPRTKFVAGFIGSPRMNLVTGGLAEPYAAHTVGIRPESMEITAAPEGWPGTVTHVENLGSDLFVYVDIGTQTPIVVRQGSGSQHHPGDKIRVLPKPDECHRFDAEGFALHR